MAHFGLGPLSSRGTELAELEDEVSLSSSLEELSEAWASPSSWLWMLALDHCECSSGSGHHRWPPHPLPNSAKSMRSPDCAEKDRSWVLDFSSKGGRGH